VLGVHGFQRPFRTISRCAIAGRVTSGGTSRLGESGGLPLPGAAVTATQGDKKLSTTTDEQGAYSFADLPDGTWTIQVEMFGFAPISREVGIAPNAPSPDWEMKQLSLSALKQSLLLRPRQHRPRHRRRRRQRRLLRNRTGAEPVGPGRRQFPGNRQNFPGVARPRRLRQQTATNGAKRKRMARRHGPDFSVFDVNAAPEGANGANGKTVWERMSR